MWAVFLWSESRGLVDEKGDEVMRKVSNRVGFDATPIITNIGDQCRPDAKNVRHRNHRRHSSRPHKTSNDTSYTITYRSDESRTERFDIVDIDNPDESHLDSKNKIAL